MNKTMKKVFSFLSGLGIGGVFGAYWVGKNYDAHCAKLERDADKFSVYYTSTLQWVKLYQSGKTSVNYFKNKGYKTIAVYGINDLAKLLMNDIKESDVEILYGIDRNADNLFLEMKCYRPDEKLPQVDVCIVALPDLYKDISVTLSQGLSCPIVSIEDVVWES